MSPVIVDGQPLNNQMQTSRRAISLLRRRLLIGRKCAMRQTNDGVNKMPCDLRLKPKQTISQRADEVRRMVEKLSAGLASGRYKVVVSRQGAIAFAGLTEAERDGVTDACAYRRIMSTGSQAAKLAIMRAEQLAGVSVNRQVLAHGVHSHDSGVTWSHGHKH
jgi:hypothetical protein